MSIIKPMHMDAYEAFLQDQLEEQQKGLEQEFTVQQGTVVTLEDLEAMYQITHDCVC